MASGILVVLVVFCFLRNVRATLIPAVAVASSIIGTFAVMYLFGYSLDNLSLMALTISTGFVVDDAIVVLENIIRYLEQGQSPFQAALSRFQGNRLHGSFHEYLTGGGIHTDPDDGWNGRAVVPRVRRHSFRRRSWCRC
jgi:hypothetical protein